jgi:signal transduction histidine kinase
MRKRLVESPEMKRAADRKDRKQGGRAAEGPLRRASWQRLLPIGLAVVVICFVGSTAFAHYRLALIDRESSEIAQDAAPSIQHLSAARAEMRHLQLVVAQHVDRRMRGLPRRAGEIRASRDAIEREIDAYLQLPLLNGESAAYERAHRSLLNLDRSINDVLATIDEDPERAYQNFQNEVVPAAQATSDALDRAIKIDAQEASNLATKIGAQRRYATRLEFVLDTLSAVLAVAAAIVLTRAIRSNTRLVEAHAKLHQQRAQELEAFAGRVAHDILNPIGNAMLAVDLVGRIRDDELRATTIVRAHSSLVRVQRIVDGLLEFARSGAPSHKEVRTSVKEVLTDLVADLRSAAADERIDLRVPAFADRLVAVRAGVLTSLVDNLARNAIKYMGESETRWIEIRVLDQDGAVRVEVEDSGPGLPPDLERTVFQPYVRGRDAKGTGIGLGLATVKRMTEAHGGRVGVRSVIGHGALFWFELPKVTRT